MPPLLEYGAMLTERDSAKMAGPPAGRPGAMAKGETMRDPIGCSVNNGDIMGDSGESKGVVLGRLEQLHPLHCLS